MHRSDSIKKSLEIKTDKWQWKIRKLLCMVIRRNMRNCDIMVQNLNCQTKQDAMEGPD
jgi:hypothetical protein